MSYRDDSYTQAAVLPTLTEYNCGAPPLENAESLPAGVRCPACAKAGTPVEMRIGLIDAVYSREYVAVACPRCLLSGHRRCTPAECKAWLKMRGGDGDGDGDGDGEASVDEVVDWQAAGDENERG